MFCPLCQSEYQEGFSTCSDCGIPLVSSVEQARETPTAKLWSGDSEPALNQVFGVLKDAGIPCNIRSQPKPYQTLWQMAKATFWLRFGAHPKSGVGVHWEVWVLEKDSSRAHEIIGNGMRK